MNENIIIFYHVAQMPRWEYLFQQQINALLVSGLYDATNSVEICLNSPFKLSYSLPFNFSKFNVHVNENIVSEADTLKRMWEFANNTEENYKILYFHTKGISYHFEKEALNVDGWRLYLEYFNIHKWKKCVDLLSYYDCVGTNFYYSPHIHYTKDCDFFVSKTNKGFYNGNFWWANSNYIKTLNPDYLYDYEAEIKLNNFSSDNYNPSDYDKLNMVRFNSEFWLGTNNPNEFTFAKLDIEFYEKNAMSYLENFERIYEQRFSKE